MRGVYRSHTYREAVSEVVHQLLDAHSGSPEHPTPFNDVGRGLSKDEYCGFDSAIKLLQWFKGFIPDLLRAGYEIVALNDVKVTAVGEKQVLFKFN